MGLLEYSRRRDHRGDGTMARTCVKSCLCECARCHYAVVFCVVDCATLNTTFPYRQISPFWLGLFVMSMYCSRCRGLRSREVQVASVRYNTSLYLLRLSFVVCSIIRGDNWRSAEYRLRRTSNSAVSSPTSGLLQVIMGQFSWVEI